MDLFLGGVLAVGGLLVLGVFLVRRRQTIKWGVCTDASSLQGQVNSETASLHILTHSEITR